MRDKPHCPLCGGSRTEHYFADRRRAYHLCNDCSLVFVAPESLPDREAELQEYLLHHNDITDPGYRKFLGRLAGPLLQRLPPAARGLDFGCGPGPALADMLEQAGHSVALYDSFFYPDRSVLQDGGYDFICATEVVEHLHRPGPELGKLWSLLAPGGWLGVMTKLVIDKQAFANWHYKNDPTHVGFFSQATWRWWGGRVDARLEFVGADVILLQKS